MTFEISIGYHSLTFSNDESCTSQPIKRSDIKVMVKRFPTRTQCKYYLERFSQKRQIIWHEINKVSSLEDFLK